MKSIHQKLLSVTSQYESESYDYPPNLRESFADLSKTVTEKIHGLSQAKNTEDARAVLTQQSSPEAPKTLNHALSRAAAGGAKALSDTFTSEPLATALDKFSLAESKIGDARLAQDQLIKSHFNKPVSESLRVNIGAALAARRKVENARLSYDSLRAKIESANSEKQSQIQVQLDAAEDEFANATDEAVSVMRNALDSAEPLKSLVEFIGAQLAYHQASYQILQSLLPDVEALKEDQESELAAHSAL